MCVQIQEWVRNPSSKTITAWKVISAPTSRNFWRPIIWSDSRFMRGKWVRAWHPTYAFNLYASKEAAMRWRDPYRSIVKVKARHVEGYGYEGWGRKCKVIFAREILVPLGRRRK